jgi:hypothetical protein
MMRTARAMLSARMKKSNSIDFVLRKRSRPPLPLQNRPERLDPRASINAHAQEKSWPQRSVHVFRKHSARGLPTG